MVVISPVEEEAAGKKSTTGEEEVDEEVVVAAVDHFSSLPNHLVARILSALPLADLVRTAALSTAWRPILRSGVDDVFFEEGILRSILPHLSSEAFTNEQKQLIMSDLSARVATNVLETNRVEPQTSCSAQIDMFFPHCPQFFQMVFARCSGIKVLVLYNKFTYIDTYCPVDIHPFQHLVILVIRDCSVHLPEQFDGLRSLKVMYLCRIRTLGDEVERLVLHCPVLEELILESWIDPRAVRIRSPTLLSLAVRSPPTSDIQVVDADRLRNVEFHFDLEDFRRMSANPLYRLLPIRDQVECLGLYCFAHSDKNWDEMPDKFPQGLQMSKLKTLKFLTNMISGVSHSILAFMLQASPNLEELILLHSPNVFTVTPIYHCRPWGGGKYASWRGNRLKHVRLFYVDTSFEWWTDLMRFFVSQVEGVESIAIFYDKYSVDWRRLQDLVWLLGHLNVPDIKIKIKPLRGFSFYPEKEEWARAAIAS